MAYCSNVAKRGIPLAHRFWAREYRTGTTLLTTVRGDLSEVIAVCKGEVRQTNHNRALLHDLPKGIIPSAWKIYAIPKAMSLNAWVADLAKRLEQLEKVTKESRLDGFPVQLGHLFAPGAYMTATRQAVAHKAGVSLEHLTLKLQLNERPEQGLAANASSDAASAAGAYALTGLKLEGATWSEGQLELNDGSAVELDTCTLRWEDKGGKPQMPAGALGSDSVPVTVYLNADRAVTLFHLALATRRGADPSAFAQRAVALRAA